MGDEADDERRVTPHGGLEVRKVNLCPGFVELDVRSVSNRISRSFTLDLHLEVDEWSLAISRPPGLLQRFVEQFSLSESNEANEIRLRIRLHHCYVRYRCEGVNIPGNSKYRSATEIGSYSDKHSSSDKTASTRNLAGNLGGGVKSDSTSVGVSVDAAARVSSQFEGSFTTERAVAATHDIYEVEAVPGGWRIGDRRHGDPLKADSLLDGPYFARRIEAHPHTCTVEFHPGCSRGKITFDLTTRDGLRVQREDSSPVSSSERDHATAMMRDKLAEICIVGSAPLQMSEMVLATVEVDCMSDAEGETTDEN